MMKRIVRYIFCLGLVLSLCGCQQDKKVDKTIEISEMRAISEMATLECYFHNVATYEQAVEKFWPWEPDSTRFWVEYDGIVYIGIDVDKLKVTVDNDEVTVDLPQAIVLDSKVNSASLTEDSFIYDRDTKMPNEQQQAKAFEESKQNMEESAKNNSALLNNARDNTKELLENYIQSVSSITGIDYKINWNYLEAEETNEEIETPVEESV